MWFLIFPRIASEVSMLAFVSTMSYAGFIFSVDKAYCRALQLQNNHLSENFIKLVVGHRDKTGYR
ncbi:MAG: hypothetical protein DMG67_20220 [Acidobacteria bacterium]|nr:MAG: hypothetical protein DMG67_20220 [Acidobacteriota bacterium]